MSARLKELPAMSPAVRALNTPLLAMPKPKRPKYGNVQTMIDGIRFDSKLEATRYEQLKLERAAGLINYFLLQVRFDLPGGVRHYVDFGICQNDGRMTFEDAKGRDTPISILKRKQVKELYGVDIHVRQ